jgi:molybdopterin-containing oxidoreductase family membrane subunit
MRNGSTHDGGAVADTPSGVTHDLLDRHRNTGSMFKSAVWVSGALFVLGIVGFVLRLRDGTGDPAVWGYHAAVFAFILTTAQAAPMAAIVPRLAKGHWGRPFSRVAEIFAVVGLFNLLVFIPLLWVLPSLADGRRTLWFYDPADPDFKAVPVFSPHIWATLALVSLIVIGLALLWVSSLPDFAAIRDSSSGRRRRVYARLAHGWNGTSRQWHILYHRMGMLGAFYFVMLVFVHFLIAVDFNMTLVPGWIDALFPATHAANSLQAGVAAVLVTMFVLRRFGGYRDYIGIDQFWGMGKLLFALSLLWFWFWFSSFIVLWYGAKPSQQAVLELMIKGPYIWVFMTVFILNFVAPLVAMIWNPLRKSVWGPTLVAAGVLVGTLLDRIRLYVAAYSVPGIGDAAVDKHELQDVPAAVLPDAADIFILLGAISGSILVYLLASRLIPAINIWEQKELLLYRVHKRFHRAEVLVLGKRD